MLLIAKYNYVGVDYLMIALLEGKESVTVSEALELRHIQYLDIGKLNLVARRSHRVENPKGFASLYHLQQGQGRSGWGISSWICWGREAWMPESRTRGCCRRWTITATAASSNQPKHQ